ncbi:hypothetical protein HOH45_02500 [bacterium]|jgi:DNA-binding phage protein|nr:hypothetical protein [bacterium]
MRKWRETLIEKLKYNPEEASEYLNAALEAYDEEQDMGAFLVALKTLVEAKGGIQWLSEKTKLNRSQLYRMLSSSGNPTLYSLNLILPVVGMRLKIIKAKENV